MKLLEKIRKILYQVGSNMASGGISVFVTDNDRKVPLSEYRSKKPKSLVGRIGYEIASGGISISEKE